MMDLQRNILMRYLHERGEMSQGERRGVAWRLLVHGESRKEYAEMERMHRALSLHFAPHARVAVPASPLRVWLRVGLAGLTGATVIACLLLWTQKTAPANRSLPKMTATARSNSLPRMTGRAQRCNPSPSPRPAATVSQPDCPPQ